MSIYSAIVKLAVRLAHLNASPVVSGRGPHPYDAAFREELFERLRAVETRDRSMYGEMKSVGLRLADRAKKLLTKRAPCPAPPAVSPSGSFNIPHIFITEDVDGPFNPIRRRARVTPHRDACNAPTGYDADCSLESAFEQDFVSELLDLDLDHAPTALSAIWEDNESWEEFADADFDVAYESDDGEHYEITYVSTGTPPPLSDPELADSTLDADVSNCYDTPASPFSDSSFDVSPAHWRTSPPVSPFLIAPTPSLSDPSSPSSPSEDSNSNGPNTPEEQDEAAWYCHEPASFEAELLAEFKAIATDAGMLDAAADADDDEWDELRAALTRRVVREA
ncbi:hypothetical protein BC834DRAFT_554528 [Gloeopeniophorella convolvens]|nr:hypothetical protein BC834DRAFT_554528 [Gloeopeniophorella convolvens]